MHSSFHNFNFCASTNLSPSIGRFALALRATQSRFQPKGLFTVLAAAGAFLTAPGAVAEVVLATKADATMQLEQLPTGDQLVLEGYSGTLEFAGEQLVLDGFSGVLGYATEVAYAAVIEGHVQAGGRRVSRGKMLMIAPFGQGIVSERFDANRLHRALANTSGAESYVTTMVSLEKLAGRQGRDVFLGRLTRTDFNVGTMGSASAERGRRSRVGGIGAREARFGAPQSIGGSEERIVTKFVHALIGGDADKVGEFIDPLPYGAAANGVSGVDVRRVAANSLLDLYNWQQFADFQTQKTGDTSWLVTGGGQQAQIELRRTSDFAFIQSIQVGE